jgi:8-oxo-dGTP diphosphatase
MSHYSLPDLDPSLPVRTLCLLVDGEPSCRVLLGYKKAGFGQGKYTGFGGKVEAGESIEAAARREMLEESGVRVMESDCRLTGCLVFQFPSRPTWSQVVYVYIAHTWSGEPVESDEMIPAWFGVHELPFPMMWQDARHWLTPILEGRKITARFVFQDDNETIGEVEIEDWQDD